MPNNISCIIVDDEQDAIELLTDRIGKLYKNITIKGTYFYWEDALKALREEECDLLITDISMPGKNGLELLKLLPNLQAEIIFVTAHEQYAINAFSFSTSGYILKPVDDEELSAAIGKAIERIQNKKLAKQPRNIAPVLSERIGIANNHGIDYLVINEILYLESTNKCTKIITSHTEYTSSYNLGKFKDMLVNHPFFQVHRSYIVNLNSILRYESSGVVIMVNKMEIPVARNVKNDFLQLFEGHL